MENLSTQNLANSIATTFSAPAEDLRNILQNIPWEKIANCSELFD